MTAPIDEARLREAVDRIEGSLADLLGEAEVMMGGADLSAWYIAVKASDLRMVLDALSAERERADRAVAVLKWHTDDTVREIVDHEALATQSTSRTGEG